MIGAVAGWYLAQRSHRREVRQDRLESSRDTRLLLRGELNETRKRLRREVPRSILNAPGLDRFDTFPTSAYEELASAGRLIQLGPSAAEAIHRIYGTITTVNDLLQEINSEMEPMRDAEIEGTFDDLWQRVVECKRQFMKQLKVVDSMLTASD